MWQELVNWSLDFLSKIGDYYTLLFTRLYELEDIAEDMSSIPGLDSNAMFKFFARLLPNFRIIDLLSLGGLVVLCVIIIIKLVDPFGG